MSRAVVLVASCSLLACVQTGSVGSDTGRSDDDVDASESAGVDTAASDEGTTDPHQACRDVETVDEP